MEIIITSVAEVGELPSKYCKCWGKCYWKGELPLPLHHHFQVPRLLLLQTSLLQSQLQSTEAQDYRHRQLSWTDDHGNSHFYFILEGNYGPLLHSSKLSPQYQSSNDSNSRVETYRQTDRHTDSGDLSPTRTCVPYVLLATV